MSPEIQEEKLILKAMAYAKAEYSDIKRLNGESVYDQLERIYKTMKKSGVESPELLAAVFFEPNPTDDRIKQFGNPELNKILDDYAALERNKASEINLTDENLSKIIQTYMNLSKDSKGLILRMFVKADDITTALFHKKARATISALRGLHVYSPICRVLGLYSLTKIFEEHAFKILYPREYYKIREYVESQKRVMEHKLKDATKFINEILSEESIECKIQTRFKTHYSLYHKLILKKGKNPNRTLTDIHDITAMRIIVKTEEDCYKVEDLLNSIWDQVPDTREDYISSPKPSGYKSLHATYEIKKGFDLEVQIRTQEMHDMSEYGLATHAFYKLGSNSGKILLEAIKQNEDFLKQTSFKENKEHLKTGYFTDKIYVFTPKGDIIELPRGACVVDFAYKIHSELADKCIGAEVNGNFVDTAFLLNDGDKVEIKIDHSKKLPGRDWLKVVKTSKARIAIRRALSRSAGKK